MTTNDPSNRSTPKWYWTIGVSLLLGYLYFAVPARFDSAAAGAASGAIAGAIGALIGYPFDRLTKSSVFTPIVGGIGFVTGTGFELATGFLLDLTIGEQAVARYVSRMMFGAIVGAIVGLVPQYLYRHGNQRNGDKYYWICVACGAVGGGLIAIPIAIFLSVRKWNGRRFTGTPEG